MPSPLVTASGSGSSPLVKVAVSPQSAPGQSVRGFRVDLISGATVLSSTGFKLGTSALVSVAGSPTTSRSALRSEDGTWSEWGSQVAFTSPGSFSAGSTEAGIGSGATSDLEIQQPGLEFPDLSSGSGIMSSRRTYVGRTNEWLDEVRETQWGKGRTAFHVILKDLSLADSEILSRFWRVVTNTRAFFFDYVDPSDGWRTTGGATRYLVKFRDASLSKNTTEYVWTDAEFVLVEVMEDPESA